MNKFPITIDGKEYTFTVNRRTNILINKADNKQFKMLDLGLTYADIEKIQQNEEALFEILKERNIPISTFAEITSDDDYLKYEDMFYECLKVSHPEFDDREKAMELMDKAEEEMGLIYLKKALSVMSQKVFTMNENSKKIDWLEIETAKNNNRTKKTASK